MHGPIRALVSRCHVFVRINFCNCTCDQAIMWFPLLIAIISKSVWTSLFLQLLKSIPVRQTAAKCSIRCWDAAVVQVWLCSMCNDSIRYHCIVAGNMWTAVYSRDLLRRNVRLSLRQRSSCLFSDNTDSRGFWAHSWGQMKKLSGLAIARRDPRHRTLIFTLSWTKRSNCIPIWLQ